VRLGIYNSLLSTVSLLFFSNAINPHLDYPISTPYRVAFALEHICTLAYLELLPPVHYSLFLYADHHINHERSS
jgi:hypothetical protein